jgi:glutamine cyclotransferase
LSVERFISDGKQIYMDGSRDVQAEQSDAEIRILAPETLKETGIINATAEGMRVKNLNELEMGQRRNLRQYLANLQDRAQK